MHIHDALPATTKSSAFIARKHATERGDDGQATCTINTGMLQVYGQIICDRFEGVIARNMYSKNQSLAQLSMKLYASTPTRHRQCF